MKIAQIVLVIVTRTRHPTLYVLLDFTLYDRTDPTKKKPKMTISFFFDVSF